MQCTSCRFENMPGLTSCGRCGSPLDFGAIAIDVHPPRASRTAKRFRRWVPRFRLYQARDLVAESIEATSARFRLDFRVPLPAPPIARRLIVPGWAHIHTGFGFPGWIYLAAYAALLCLGVLNWGYPLGAILLGLAFSVHVSSVLDILVRQATVRFPSMLATGLVVSAALALGVYGPVGWALSRVAATREFDYNAPPFERFDVVLFNRWAFLRRPPRAGDVVLYRPGTGRIIPADVTVQHRRELFLESECIDRVLGGPGDRVHWNDGRLSINGNAVPWTPLVPQRFPSELQLTVPQDRYLILPSTSRVDVRAVPAEEWVWLGCHPAEEILGVAYLRLKPLSRFWLIR
jgi:hypothetical protein